LRGAAAGGRGRLSARGSFLTRFRGTLPVPGWWNR
jgi:hypothetical protein